MGVPNQENVTNPANRVTYHDTAGNKRMILLPNRELMQAQFFLAVDISF